MLKNINFMEKKYVFKKNYETSFGVIPKGSEITIFRGFVYINGGMCSGGYSSILRNIIEDKDLHQEYLTDFKIEKNEF